MFKQSMGHRPGQPIDLARIAPLCSEDVMGHVQDAVDENNELKRIAQDMQEEIDYGKQRENKLMFFLFILKEKGFPISEVFE